MKTTITVSISFDVFFSQDASGYWTATSKYGMASAPTQKECIRILEERAKQGY